MQLFTWDDIKKEMLSENLGRKVINGEKATLAQIFVAKGAVIPKRHHESGEMGSNWKELPKSN